MFGINEMNQHSPAIRTVTPDLARLAVFLFATVAFYAIPWSRVGAPAGLPLLLLYSLLLPGTALRSLLFPTRREIGERLAIALFLGLAWLLAIAFLWGANGGALAGLHSYLPLFLLPPLLFPFARVHPAPEPAPGEPLSGGRVAAHLLMVAILALVILYVYSSGPPVDFTKDTLDHVGYVDEIRQTGAFFPTDAVYEHAGANGNDLRKGVLHYVTAFYAGHFEMSTWDFMRLCNALLAAVMLLGIYATALLCFSSAAIAILAVVICLLATGGGLATPIVRQAIYTNQFGIVFYLLFAATAMLYLARPLRRRIPALWLFAFAAGAVHVFYGVLAGFAVLVALVWKKCFPQLTVRDHVRRVLVIGLTALAALAPYFAYRYLTSWHGTNELHTEIQGVMLFTTNLFVADPVRVWRWLSLPGVIACLTVIPLWREREDNTMIGFLIAAVITVPLVMFNPLLLPLLYRGMGYLVSRLIYIAPFYLLAAYFYASIVSRRKTDPAGSASVLLALALTVAIAFATVQPVRTGALGARARDAERARSPLLWKAELARLEAQLPDSSVILSDPLTSYSIPAFTRFHVVSTLDQHAPPNDLELPERVQRSRDVLSPYVPLSRTTELLAASGADYVIVNGRIPPGIKLHYFTIEPDLVPEIRKKFLSRPDLFEPVLDVDRFLVVRWNGKRSPSHSVSVIPPFFRSLPASSKKIFKDTGAVTLAGYRVPTRTVRRGETLAVELFWSSTSSRSIGNYTVTLRLDKMNQELPYDGKPFPKLSRKLKELLEGDRYRLRADHLLAGGFLSPDTWPIERFVLDRTTLRIPDSLAPGTYALHATLLKLPDMPAYHVRDILYDKDMFQGPRIAEITIQ